MFVTEQQNLINEISQLVKSHGTNRSALIPILSQIQKEYSYISEHAMLVVADMLEIPPVEVYGVASFYSFLDQKPKGKFIIRLCKTISCDMLGKDKVAGQLENELGIKFGETTKDGKFTLEWANCLGMCDKGPALLVNDQVFTSVTPEKVFDIVEGCRSMLNSNVLQ